MPTPLSELPWYRRWTWRKVLLRSLLAGTCLLAIATGLVHWHLRSSLPILDGQFVADGLSSNVNIDRDEAGVPTITSSSRTDTAFALGFLHAQERFFQMDLLRRMSSGRVSALFGPQALALDEKHRKHRFQVLAQSVANQLPEAHKALLDTYTQGVNIGLSQLSAAPFEYALLRASPEPWQTVDCVYVMLTMLADLQPVDGDIEVGRGRLHERVPAEVFEFLVRKGSYWDAALDDSTLDPPQVPSEAVWSLREGTSEQHASNVVAALPNPKAFLFPSLSPELMAASNNWAVSSQLGKDKRAILASDMHLGLSVPTIWYRAVMQTPCLDGQQRRLVGVTLPGIPALVEGSNGTVAWGMTNSQGDFGDIVELVPIEGEPDQYLTPEGPQTIERFTEEIVYAGGSKQIEYEWSVWGPVVVQRGQRRFVHHWVGDDPTAIDTGLFALETATSIQSAVELCNRAGSPHLNVVIADRDGNVGWTLCGRIPRRTGLAPNVPVDWSQGGQWQGYLEPEEYPRVVNPADGRVWTANNRVIGGTMMEIIGDGAFDKGGRARQIRDRLRNKSQFDEKDMLTIQLDDEALFVTRWHALLTSTMNRADGSLSHDFKEAVDQWGGRASIQSVGYRLVKEFRRHVTDTLFGVPNAQRDANRRGAFTDIVGIDRYLFISHEEVIWQLLEERPLHWLPKAYESWDALLVDAAQATEQSILKAGALQEANWGQSNASEIRHPISMALPFLAPWLDMPELPLPGDDHMPRVQHPGYGASERMVVSPGFEETGIYHQPGGQSGHPYSPYYRAGFQDWAEGRASPLLPGPTKYTLQLLPKPR